MKGNKTVWVVFLLIVLNLGLLLRHYQLKQALAEADHHQSSSVTLGSDILRHRFRRLDGQPVQLSESSEPYLLLFIFRLTDCPPCVEELSLYSGRDEQLGVYGLALDTNEAELSRFLLQGTTFQVPMLIDETPWLSPQLPAKSTPAKLLIKRASAQVLLADGPRFSPERQQQFRDRVNCIVGEKK